MGLGIPCFFHEITGYYCPGCGITRSLVSLLHLDFYQALRYNALTPMFLILAYFYIKGEINFYLKGKTEKFPIRNEILIVLLILTITYGVLRNIPAFDYLAPTYLGS